jgi:hypothetical protein
MSSLREVFWTRYGAVTLQRSILSAKEMVRICLRGLTDKAAMLSARFPHSPAQQVDDARFKSSDSYPDADKHRLSEAANWCDKDRVGHTIEFPYILLMESPIPHLYIAIRESRKGCS